MLFLSWDMVWKASVGMSCFAICLRISAFMQCFLFFQTVSFSKTSPCTDVVSSIQVT